MVIRFHSVRGGWSYHGGWKKETMQVSTKNSSGQSFYTVSEVCQMLKVDRKTVYRLLERGLLKSSTALRHKRIYSGSFDAFVDTTVYGGAQ